MNKQDKDQELQRLKQENEKLKRHLKDLGKIIEILTEDNMQLKIALEKSEQAKRLLAFDRNRNAYFVDEDNKYEQALKEIKEIIVECNNCCVEPPAMKFKCPECKEEMIEKIQSIIYENKELLEE